MNLLNKINLFLNESKIKVNVKKFKTRKEVDDFISSLGMFDTPDEEIYDPETGELLMEPGQTKKDIERNKKQMYYKRFGGDAVPTFDFKQSRDEDEIKDYYNIIEKPISSLVDDPDELSSLDYDISWDIPVHISCKKMRSFTDEDVYNIKKYIEFKNKNIHKFSPNLSIILDSPLHKGVKKVKTTVTFH